MGATVAHDRTADSSVSKSCAKLSGLAWTSFSQNSAASSSFLRLNRATGMRSRRDAPISPLVAPEREPREPRPAVVYRRVQLDAECLARSVV